MSAMCTCASGCDRHPLSDPGVFPPCRCWCHETKRERLAPLRAAALPKDAPGAWIRAAIDALGDEP